MSGPAEERIGLLLPSHVYPMFEQALRIANNESSDEHRKRIGELWARFSAVAADNPHAWSREALPAEQIWQPGPDNRMISWPYPKLMNSNNMVDQAAVVVLCSAEKAAYLQIPRDQWVFPYAGTDSHDTYSIAERDELHRSPAIRIGGRRALELAGVGVDDLDYVDVYSCFPSAVQVAAAELRLPLDDPQRPLTVTGGLTFAGGPWNNYVMHSIATMTELLRGNPEARSDHRQRRLPDQAQLRRLQRHPAAGRVPQGGRAGRGRTSSRPAPPTWTGRGGNSGVVDHAVRPGRPPGEGVPDGAHPRRRPRAGRHPRCRGRGGHRA